MPSIKQLAFAPLFLGLFAFTCYKISEILTDYQFLFSVDSSSLIQMLIICALFLLSALSFVLFVTFASNWKIVAPVVLIALTLPLIFTPQPVNFVLSIGFLVAFMISFLGLENKLKTYLNFQPSVLFTPNIKSLATMLIFVTCFGFYLTTSREIKQNGFSLPDLLIDTVLQAIPLDQSSQMLQENGIDPTLLDTNQIQDAAIQTVKTALDQVMEPYLPYLAIFIALILFFTLNWIASFLSLLLSPLLWAIFASLTKSGFASFTTEMREVKKLVV